MWGVGYKFSAQPSYLLSSFKPPSPKMRGVSDVLDNKSYLVRHFSKYKKFISSKL